MKAAILSKCLINNLKIYWCMPLLFIFLFLQIQLQDNLLIIISSVGLALKGFEKLTFWIQRIFHRLQSPSPWSYWQSVVISTFIQFYIGSRNTTLFVSSLHAALQPAYIIGLQPNYNFTLGLFIRCCDA